MIRHTIGGLIYCSMLASSVAAGEWNPPLPNPAAPVNYIRWFNETFGGRIKGENAADLYQEAYQSYKPLQGSLDKQIQGPWSENLRVNDWLRANKETFAKFREASRMPIAFFRLEAPPHLGAVRLDNCLAQVPEDTLRVHRKIALGLIAAGYRAWERGNQKRAVKNALTVLRSAHHCNSVPTLANRLGGYGACAAWSYYTIRNALHLADVRKPLLDELVPTLTECDPPPASLHEVCRFARLRSWDVCQRLFEPDPIDGTLKPYAPAARILLGMAGLSTEDRKRIAEIGYQGMLDQTNAYFDAVDAWLEVPYYQAAQASDQLEALIDQSRNPLAKKLWASVTELRLRDVKLAAERRATHLVVYLIRQRRKTGAYPDSLDNLKAPDLAELRIDPFSGRDFVYQRRGHDFVLYTVSVNGTDEHGKHDPHGEADDYVFWPILPE
jgi:hypothetical protein